MSVICKNIFDSKYRVFVKGSPEKMKELSNSATLPHNFDEVLE
jgi:magnesium-transporting ATPase (P-type)